MAIHTMSYLKTTLHKIKKKYSASHAEELYVSLQLSKSLPDSEYTSMSDLLLPNDGPIRTSQIDHLVVSLYGIFCIETKSHRGWIFGSKTYRLFTQVLYRNNYKITPNPVDQNSNHIKTLTTLLGDGLKAPIVNVVVFPSADKFFIDGYKNVGSVNDMIETILKYQLGVYSHNETLQIIETIGRYNIKKTIEHIRHIERVKEAHPRA